MSSDTPDAFERRTRELLQSSAAAIDGRVRSRLTQARHAALAAHASMPSRWRFHPAWRNWAPAGAVAAAVLVTLFMVGQPPGHALRSGSGDSAAIEDMELLADSDALDMAQDQAQRKEADYDFFEWAAQEATGDDAVVGT